MQEKLREARHYHERQLKIKYGLVPLSNLVQLSHLLDNKAQRHNQLTILRKHFGKLRVGVSVCIVERQREEDELGLKTQHVVAFRKKK